MGFVIPHVAPMSNRNVRLPDELLAEVDAAIEGLDCNFSAFVAEALRFALDHLSDQEA